MSSFEDHYAHLAAEYDLNWSHGEAFLAWMTQQITVRIVDEARTGQPNDHPFRLLDIGSGTGLFARRLLPELPAPAEVLCVEPSSAMLDETPVVPGLVPVLASADETPDELAALGVIGIDAVLLKEVVHHFEDPARSLSLLSELLEPGGRLLVVMLPPHIDYPLFPEAIRRYEAAQPHYESIAAALAEAGLTVVVAERAFPLTFPTDRYLSMVANRYMSVLSTFSDDELEAGINEMRLGIGGAPTITFSDSFAFVLGIRSE